MSGLEATEKDGGVVLLADASVCTSEGSLGTRGDESASVFGSESEDCASCSDWSSVCACEESMGVTAEEL